MSQPVLISWLLLAALADPLEESFSQRSDHQPGFELGGEERRLRWHQQAFSGGPFDLGDTDRPDQYGC